MAARECTDLVKRNGITKPQFIFVPNNNSDLCGR
jgi:hypothetical protein